MVLEGKDDGTFVALTEFIGEGNGSGSDGRRLEAALVAHFEGEAILC